MDVVETLPANCVDRHLHDHTLLFAERAFCIISKYPLCYTGIVTLISFTHYLRRSLDST